MPDKYKPYFNLVKNDQSKKVTINIFGDISSYDYDWSDAFGVKKLSRQLNELEDITDIDVYINSYGGELAEGLAVYNALKMHKAKVTTYDIGFACSSASIIFMSGDERIMSNASILMVHNALQYGYGNAKDHRKIADDLEILSNTLRNAYIDNTALSEKEITKLMDNDTIIAPEDALNWGFATKIVESDNESVNNSCFSAIFKKLVEKNNNFEEKPEENELNSLKNEVEELKKGIQNIINKVENEQKEPEKEPENIEKSEQNNNYLNNFMNAFMEVR